MVVVTAPAFVIPVNPPSVDEIVLLLMILVLISAVAGAEAFKMPTKAPVPELEPDIILLVVMVSALPAVAESTSIPVNVDAAVPKEEQF